ncbi:PRC-barrel domain-containing protein [Kribbella sp. NPDC023972]|uniref:PRC-barrel domain-containing protein n=1 Tax=Kribbella sp. NPDC023972 TaxID=3154795 RepID=UPI0033D1D270
MADSEVDIRGRTVEDLSGDEVGNVDGLIIDEDERRVRFIEVSCGAFLGFGGGERLVPADAITRVGDSVVQISPERIRVAAGPAYDPDAVLEQQYYEDVYVYYDYPPLWAPGYKHPGTFSL